MFTDSIGRNLSDWKKGDGPKVVEKITRVKEMTFASLHHHSSFSYLDGFGMPEDHVKRAAELGMTSLALSEHGNVTSHVQLEKAGKAYGVKPIFGVELYTGGVEEEDRTQRKNHLTVLAKDVEGYRNLLRLVSRGWAEGFFYEPTVSGPMLAEHASGLVVLSGCSGSLLATSLIGGKNIDPADASYVRALDTARRFQRSLGDGYFLEVQAFPELEKTRTINQGIARIAGELGIPLVATLDAHYTKPEEGEIQAILHNVRPGKKRTLEMQMQSWGYDVPLCPLTDKEIYERLVGTGLTKKQSEQAIRNARTIADMCNVEIPKVDNLRYPLPPGMTDPTALLRRWMNDGWKHRRINELPAIRDYMGFDYKQRAQHEMDLVISQGFTDYFLIVSDAVRFCKDISYRPPEFQHYPTVAVGPARGSAAASLVCWLLRITEVNPMLFPNLLFERFIDANRKDLPDIDLDFDDEWRWLVRGYLVWKYGEERVGNIATFTRYKGKNSLDDVARVHRIPEEDVQQVKNLLIERASGDLRASATIEDSIEMFPQVKAIFDKHPDLYRALALEGNVKAMSVHAAGLVIANGPLSDFCAVYTRIDPKTGKPSLDANGDVAQVVSLDKHDAEYLNVLKLDALGLKTMAVIRIALEHIGMSLDDLYRIPLDDPETIQGFKDNDVVGIFQFDGRAMRSVNAGVIPDNFMEVADVNALARPGPLHSGATAEYIDVKHGRKEAVHYHEIVDDITRHTNFQIVYQEQILQVVRLLGGFDWDEAARIRKIISKKRGEQEFNQQRDKFVEGARVHGMEADQGNRVFSLLATAGAYAFNAAHCISYGMLAMWTMWLKRHHPQAFYTASLRKYADKQSDLLRDLHKHGRAIEVKPLHLNKSQASWTMDNEHIRPGFQQVNGIAEKTSDALLAKREALGGFVGWEDVLSVKGVGPKTVDAMYDFIYDSDPYGLTLLTQKLNVVREDLRKGIYDGAFTLPEPTHTAAEVPYERTDKDVEVVWLGVIRERNLKDLFELHHSRTGEHLDPDKVKDPHLNEWVVLTGEDDTDLLVVTVDRWRYRRFKAMAWGLNPNKDLVLVRGLKKKIQSRRAIYVSDMWILNPDDEEQEDATDSD